MRALCVCVLMYLSNMCVRVCVCVCIQGKRVDGSCVMRKVVEFFFFFFFWITKILICFLGGVLYVRIFF